MAAVTICSDFGAQKNKVWHCFHCFPIYFPWSDGTRCYDLSFLNVLVFCKPTFSLSSFTFINKLFSSSSLSAIKVVFISAYLWLLIFLLEILIPACSSSSPAFLMMYSAYKLNKQGDNIQPWRTPFPIWNQSVVPCPVLTVASWPVYRFLKRQVRWSNIPISFRIFHSLLMGLGPLKEEIAEISLTLSPTLSHEDTGRGQQSADQEEGSLQKLTMPASWFQSWSQTSSLWNCKK